MYLFLIFLFTFILLNMLKVRISRLHRMVVKFPSALPELPIVGVFLNILGNSEDIMDNVRRASYATMKLGGATRFIAIHRYYIGLTDASDIAEVLSLYLDKDYIYTFLQAVTGKGSVFAPASIAKIRRRIVLPSFTPRILNSFIDVIAEESVRLAEMLAPHAGTGPFYIEEYFKVFNFNTIINVSGVKDILLEYSGKEFGNSWNHGLDLALKRIGRIWLYPNFLHKYSSNYSETQQYVKIMNDSAKKVIERRRVDLENCKQPLEDRGKANIFKKGIFDSLLYSELSHEEIREEVVVLLGANDLTSLALGYTLLLLALYPSVQDKLYKELEHVFGGSDRPLVKDDLMKLSYLDRVIKETLRLFPPAPVIVREANKEATLSSGRIVPEGTGIFSFILGLHRNPKYWGPQANHFDPDRFLPERFEKVHPKAFMPFSYGARNCMGYKYGLLTMKAALLSILRRYKVVGEPAKGPIPNIRTKFEIFMKPVDNFKIELVNRF